MTIDREALFGLTPRASAWCKQALTDLGTVLPAHEIDTVLRASHFLAQVCHETGGLTSAVENLNYSAEGLMRTWPSRFPTLEDAKRLAHQPKAIANRVYMGRLGNIHPDDGWTFRGRGLLQLTGRDNYRSLGALLGLELVEKPDLVVDPAHALTIACGVWLLHACTPWADRDDIVGVTKAINGGLIGLASRRRWRDKMRSVVKA